MTVSTILSRKLYLRFHKFHLRFLVHTKCFCLHHVTESEIRKNAINIQMLSPKLHNSIFGSEHMVSDDKTLSKVQEHLESHNLWNKPTSKAPPVNFDLPALHGKNIEDHFHFLGTQQISHYQKLINNLMDIKLPKIPSKWYMEPGWIRYDTNGSIDKVDFPLENSLVFDIEVLVREGQYPTLATAVSSQAWYCWCSRRINDDHPIDPNNTLSQVSLDDLIPLETKKMNIKQCDHSDIHNLNSASIPRIIIGHNVGFDRTFVREQYFVECSRLRFLDTMSLHICVAGMTGFQRILYQARESGSNRKEILEIKAKQKVHGPPIMRWADKSSMNNLQDVHRLYCPNSSPLQKSTRDIFVTGCMKDVRVQFQQVAQYCATDVFATWEVLQKIWPLFQKRLPHPVTLAGMLEMGTSYLPVDHSWSEYILSSEKVYEDLQTVNKQMLMNLAHDACSFVENDAYKKDPWLWDLDWSCRKSASPTSKRQPHMPAYPRWYAELVPRNADKPAAKTASDCKFVDGEPSDISLSKRISAKLLRLTWQGFPLHHSSEHGWGYVVPGRPISASEIACVDESSEPVFPLLSVIAVCKDHFVHKASTSNIDVSVLDRIEEQSLTTAEISEFFSLIQEDLNIANDSIGDELFYKKTKKKKSLSKSELKDGPLWHKGDGPYLDASPIGCWFFKLPHKNGKGNRVANPLAKDFLKLCETGIMKAEAGEEAQHILRRNIKCSYWKNNRERILAQNVVCMPDSLASRTADSRHKDVKKNKAPKIGAILPRVIVAGTVTRRAVEPTWLTASNALADRVGSELKSMVRSPPGFCFVGADVDSQELWLAAVLGDSHFAKIHGCTAIGWMTLQGKKSDGTDLHSQTAKLVGITRDEAKIFNYGRFYGAGQLFFQRLFMKLDHNLSLEQARSKSRIMFTNTKGTRRKISTSHFKYNGQSSDFYSTLQEIDEDYKGVQQESEWHGGSESHMFNALEKIACSSEPRTPALGAMIGQTLTPHSVGSDFMTSRINWAVQSSAVDYLHLLLVCIRWLIDHYDIKARFSISIHDEIRYLVEENDRYRAALALQIANLYTRSLFAHCLGMYDLPQSVAFFSGVDIDHCLRKEPQDECITPSNPLGMSKGHEIFPGETLDIYTILKKTNDGCLYSQKSTTVDNSSGTDSVLHDYDIFTT